MRCRLRRNIMAMSRQTHGSRKLKSRRLAAQMPIVLSAQDSKRFAEALLNPGQPNEALRAAFACQDSDVESID
ncbi:MAG: DUF1778 domain-containing protein [Candidatus Viridilinea halotolerans]|uniref:DUF1778 domain-containing protein n=1 Tax=Candidatus Viridilinea halotolerans TaxID=2491704 RepID=A0A426TZU5_9CHLR|nr:MAG: DUF1778 domain-containing protein [Candidatus Viridilinea halotolerans]